jgi:hypothetical protein
MSETRAVAKRELRRSSRVGLLLIGLGLVTLVPGLLVVAGAPASWLAIGLASLAGLLLAIGGGVLVNGLMFAWILAGDPPLTAWFLPAPLLLAGVAGLVAGCLCWAGAEPASCPCWMGLAAAGAGLAGAGYGGGRGVLSAWGLRVG